MNGKNAVVLHGEIYLYRENNNMTLQLNDKSLITKATKLVHDGKIDFAESAEIVVQQFTNKDGQKYQLKLVMELKD